jgi:RNA polymerase-binding protein DksA
MEKSRLERFRKILLELRARLVREVNQLIEALPEEMDAPGNLSHVPSHPADRDSEGVDKEIALVENEEGLLEAVDAALKRIEQGTFGNCEQCDGPIAAERLEALPHAPLCIRCAAAGENGR